MIAGFKRSKAIHQIYRTVRQRKQKIIELLADYVLRKIGEQQTKLNKHLTPFTKSYGNTNERMVDVIMIKTIEPFLAALVLINQGKPHWLAIICSHDIKFDSFIVDGLCENKKRRLTENL